MVGAFTLASCGGSGSEVEVDQAEIDSALGIKDEEPEMEVADTSAADSVERMDLRKEDIPGEGKNVEEVTVEDPDLVDEEVDMVTDPDAMAPEALTMDEDLVLDPEEPDSL